ncbi:MAG: shikimate dehydrogenase [Actinomycetota bacterium]|nr:shikimate dehydrogenase [Actinomycetota bacterium]MDI6821405.1 shikimate dehydrogenase [Actinomycetota bacterium]
MLRIDGQTKLTGIIGYPLRYTLSPVLHNAAFQHLSLNWCYVPLPVERPLLHQALEGIKALNFVGINVTMPYKEEVIPFLDEIASYARIVGAVNTIHVKGNRLIGYNTDGRGFLASLQRDAKFDPKGKNILIVGAGGAARSIAVSLALAGANYIAILNRTLERAHSLGQLLQENFPSCEVEAMDFEADLSYVFLKAEVVINATPVGMDPKSGELPFPVELLKPKHLVCDLIYKPRETLLLKLAKEKGARTLGGLGMLLHQGAAAFEIWTNLEPPIAVMRKALEEALGEDRHGEG